MVLRIGVIGAGQMGSTHIHLLSSAIAGVDVVAISDPRADTAEQIAGTVGGCRCHADGFDLIGDPDVDAVVVASPAETHAALARACIDAGKPVLCEKPLADSPAAAAGVLDAESRAGRRLAQVGFMRRFDPGHAAIKWRLDHGKLGPPVLLHCVHRNASFPAGFGTTEIITETVIHEIDTIRWLVDEEVVLARVVVPRSTNHAAEGLRDPLIVILETESGIVATVEAFVNAQYGYDIKCEVVCESGTVSLGPTGSPTVRHDGCELRDVGMHFRDRFAAAYVAELQAWTDSIVGGREPPGASAWDGYAAAAVAQACLDALHSGDKARVELRAKPGLYATPGR